MGFVKSFTNEYIDQGGSTQLTYSLTNDTGYLIVSATITDPLLANEGVTVTNLNGATFLNNGLTLLLPAGGLPLGSIFSVTLVVNVNKMIKPSSMQYSTTGKIDYVIATTPTQRTRTETSRAVLQVNSAILELSQTVSPSDGAVRAGTPIAYTITIKNTGNVSASIKEYKFESHWTAMHLINVSISDEKRFLIVGSSVVNRVVLEIKSNETITCVISGVVKE